MSGYSSIHMCAIYDEERVEITCDGDTVTLIHGGLNIALSLTPAKLAELSRVALEAAQAVEVAA